MNSTAFGTALPAEMSHMAIDWPGTCSPIPSTKSIQDLAFNCPCCQDLSTKLRKGNESSLILAILLFLMRFTDSCWLTSPGTDVKFTFCPELGWVPLPGSGTPTCPHLIPWASPDPGFQLGQSRKVRLRAVGFFWGEKLQSAVTQGRRKMAPWDSGCAQDRVSSHLWVSKTPARVPEIHRTSSLFFKDSSSYKTLSRRQVLLEEDALRSCHRGMTSLVRRRLLLPQAPETSRRGPEGWARSWGGEAQAELWKRELRVR